MTRVPSPPPSALAAATQAPKEARPSEPKSERENLFAECKDLWIRGHADPLRAPPKRTPGFLRVVPDAGCATPSGWAGIGLWRSMKLAGFSADSRFFVDGCALLRVGTGAPAGSICPDDLVVDGTPLSEMPKVARRLHALGAPAADGKWARDDLFIRWSLGPDDGVLFELRSDADNQAVEIASFSGEYSMPHVVAVSPDGRWLALVNIQPAGDDQVKLLSVAGTIAQLRPVNQLRPPW
jgi:hypothetical protein